MPNVNFSQILLSYTGRVRVAAPKAMALALLLEKHAPENMTPALRKKLEALKDAAVFVESAREERDDGGGAVLQPLRNSFAASFAATDMALEAISLLPATVSSRGIEAQKMRAFIFPDGRVFIRNGAPQACVDARRVLARIEKRKLAPKMKALIGADFLKAMIQSTDNLAEAIGLGKGAAPGDTSARSMRHPMFFSRTP